jgi:excisionase family DNA binding protein
MRNGAAEGTGGFGVASSGSGDPSGSQCPADHVTSGCISVQNGYETRANVRALIVRGSVGMIHSLLLDQAAELLGVSRRAIYYRIREGKLRTIRTRCGSQRVLVESIEDLLREEMAPVRGRGVAVSGTDLSGRSPGP